jgi:mRNA interferase HicA
VKRVDLLKKLNQMGCVMVRQSGPRDWYQDPATDMCQPIPRRREINEHVARNIIRMLSPAE